MYHFSKSKNISPPEKEQRVSFHTEFHTRPCGPNFRKVVRIIQFDVFQLSLILHIFRSRDRKDRNRDDRDNKEREKDKDDDKEKEKEKVKIEKDKETEKDETADMDVKNETKVECTEPKAEPETN